MNTDVTIRCFGNSQLRTFLVFTQWFFTKIHKTKTFVLSKEENDVVCFTRSLFKSSWCLFWTSPMQNVLSGGKSEVEAVDVDKRKRWRSCYQDVCSRGAREKWNVVARANLLLVLATFRKWKCLRSFRALHSSTCSCPDVLFKRAVREWLTGCVVTMVTKMNQWQQL